MNGTAEWSAHPFSGERAMGLRTSRPLRPFALSAAEAVVGARGVPAQSPLRMVARAQGDRPHWRPPKLVSDEIRIELAGGAEQSWAAVRLCCGSRRRVDAEQVLAAAAGSGGERVGDARH